jgi:predicted PurR-regulated permease PerM
LAVVTRDDARALVRYALVSSVVTVALAWALYRVRGALLLVYISALVAIGLAPLAAAIERQTLYGRRRVPRWAAILIIYLCCSQCSSASESWSFHPS